MRIPLWLHDALNGRGQQRKPERGEADGGSSSGGMTRCYSQAGGNAMGVLHSVAILRARAGDVGGNVCGGEGVPNFDPDLRALMGNED
ncbi:MAG: hypothetical protein KF757_00415 [Phycisphaeraceae bacterium]|nr:hypothetical protein [Phycisphaeraceae bacterium]MCW5761670.1 hypothetical protein [Phycisphaeraceae bacterium]